jgi:hypothetical protein
MPKALPKGQKQEPAKPADPAPCGYCDGSRTVKVDGVYKDCPDCAGTGHAQANATGAGAQEPQKSEAPATAAPESADGEPQGAPDGTDGDGKHGEGLFPEAPPEQSKPPAKRKRAWKATKRQIDGLQQAAEDSGWTLDQLAEYVQEQHGCGLASLKSKDDYDAVLNYIVENTP